MGNQIKKMLQSSVSVLVTIQTIRSISEVVALIAIIGIAIRQWLKGLDTLQLVLILVVATCIAIIITTYVLAWRQKRSIRYIPELLRQMEKGLRRRIETAKVRDPDKMRDFYQNVGELSKFDMSQLEAIANSENFGQVKNALNNMSSDMAESMESQPVNLITHLILLTGLMKHYGIDLHANEDEEYSILEKKLGVLRSRIQDTKTKRKVRTYMLWRDGLYNLLLLQQYGIEHPIPEEALPVKAKALLPLIESLFESVLEDLLSEVEESILSKDKNE